MAPAGPKTEAGATKAGEGVEARAAAEQEQQGREGHNSSKRAKAKTDMGGMNTSNSRILYPSIGRLQCWGRGARKNATLQKIYLFFRYIYQYKFQLIYWDLQGEPNIKYIFHS